jgi:DNA-binding beta-propeller fold protein YncE
MVAYIPRTLLDLPFGPKPFPAASVTACDSTSPDILQVHHDNALVTRLTTCPFALKKTIKVASRPLQVAVTPDGQMALVTSFDNAINFIDLNTNTVVFTLSVFFNPHGIAITSDGKTAYVASFDNINPLIATIDVASRAVTRTVQTNAYPQSVFLTPDDSQLYITFPFGNAMYIMDTMTGIIGNTFAIPNPRGVAFNSRGSKAFITSAVGGSPGSVLQFDTETFQIEQTYTVGAGPADISVLYDEVTVVVINNDGNSTSTINLKTGQVTTTPLKGPPSGLAILR